MPKGWNLLWGFILALWLEWHGRGVLLTQAETLTPPPQSQKVLITNEFNKYFPHCRTPLLVEYFDNDAKHLPRVTLRDAKRHSLYLITQRVIKPDRDKAVGYSEEPYNYFVGVWGPDIEAGTWGHQTMLFYSNPITKETSDDLQVVRYTSPTTGKDRTLVATAAYEVPVDQLPIPYVKPLKEAVNNGNYKKVDTLLKHMNIDKHVPTAFHVMEIGTAGLVLRQSPPPTNSIWVNILWTCITLGSIGIGIGGVIYGVLMRKKLKKLEKHEMEE